MIKDPHTISLQGTPLTYSLRFSTRARRLRISISDNGVTVVLPAGLSIHDGETFLVKNSVWVLQQLERRQKHQAKNAHLLLPKDVLLLRGQPTRLEVVEESSRLSRARIEEKLGRIFVYLPIGKRAAVPQVLTRWLRESARVEIETMVHRQALRMHVSPKTVTIRDQRTRWGSCSSSGTLSFNWRLIMVPPAVMEYVVVHELAHMSVPNHSANFWRLVGQYYPGYKEARTWLRKNAPLLHPHILQEV